MPKSYSPIILLLGIVSFISCTSDEDFSSEVPKEVISKSIYLDFNRWIYAQMNHDYLWRKDLPDSATCDFDLEPVTFYKSLLSSKDRFSYCEKNPSYVSTKEYTDIGYAYQTYEISGIGQFRQVLYVTDQQLKIKGLKRGDILVVTDDADNIVRGELCENIISPIDTIEFSNMPGNQNTVYLDSIYCIKNRKIGYLCYLQFDDSNDLVSPLKNFYEKKVDDVILDLRYNPGGYVSTCKYLANSLINEKGYNKIFQQCTYNDVLSREYEKATGSGITINSFTTPDNGESVLGNPMYGLNLKRLYVLTSNYSASASEAAIISMCPFMDVILIGEQTYGKGVGSWTIRDNRFKYQLQPITMRYHNAVMETTPADGLAVDYYVPDGYETRKKELGDIQEPLLAKAIQIITGIDTQNNADRKNSARVRSLPNDLKVVEVGPPSFFCKFNTSENFSR